MNKSTKQKLNALDPAFRKKFTELLGTIDESISALYEIATKDEKTQVYTNKFFENILDMEVEKAKRKQQSLSLCIVDIDFFKKINDVYGHVQADELLYRLAQLLKKQARKSDVVARFGGEEFIILLPETNLIKAKKFVDRLKIKIHEDKILKKHNLTVSGGVTQFKEGDTKKKFKERADKALYKAKNSGRDQFVVLR